MRIGLGPVREISHQPPERENCNFVPSVIGEFPSKLSIQPDSTDLQDFKSTPSSSSARASKSCVVSLIRGSSASCSRALQKSKSYGRHFGSSFGKRGASVSSTTFFPESIRKIRFWWTYSFFDMDNPNGMLKASGRTSRSP